MLGNSYGRMFRITACGESYGDALAVIIDGCPSGMEITDADVQKELDARRPGTSPIDSPRLETDQVHIFAGVRAQFGVGGSGTDHRHANVVLAQLLGYGIAQPIQPPLGCGIGGAVGQSIPTRQR